MKSRRKNLLANFFLDTGDDFPALVPERPLIELPQQNYSFSASKKAPEFAFNSFPELSRTLPFQQKTSNTVSEKQEQPSRPSQSGNITSISETPQNKLNPLPDHQGQHPQSESTKAPDSGQMKIIPKVSRRNQVFKFTWIEPRAVTKVQTQPVTQQSPQTKEPPKPEQTATQQAVNKNTENQRPLDKYVRKVINLYKKELRIESSDTSGSDHHDATESEESVQDFNMLEEIQRNHTILQFRLGNVFQKVIRGDFQRAFKQPYSTHYEYSKAKKYTPPVEKVKNVQWINLGQLKVLNINLDLNISSRGNEFDNDYLEKQPGFKKKTKVYYGEVSDTERAEHFMEIIKEAMFRGVDFILLQQAYQSLIRSHLLDLINDLACSQYGKYYYPENLENLQFSRTTLILSKHPVRFGQLNFEIKDFEHQEHKKFYFPYHAFCEFEIIVDKKIERIGILNCHLRSNGQRNSDIPPWRMRQKQLDCIHDWGKRQRYDRFFVIGDTNMPSGQKFKSQNIQADSKFFDAFDQGFTPIGGTYLFRNERNEVVDERMDRVLMNKECVDKTVVEIQYEDVLLKSCEGKKLDKKKMLVKYEDKLTYITLSDHKIMDITIYMTNKK